MLIRALISFIALPGIFAAIAPLFIAYFDPWVKDRWTPGLIILSMGAVIVFWCVRDFYAIGKGTLAPWDPPKKLVVLGLYRFVRNPMYVGVLLVVLGWAVYVGSPLLLLYLLVLAIGFHIRVVRYEEPWLKLQYGNDWDFYRQSVPRWLPRARPWREPP